jgi:hypothetical protein
MGSEGKRPTAGELKKFLRNVDPDTEITFGASKYRKRPLIFYRFKQRGERLLCIELEELDQDSEPASEIDCRLTVGEFLERLAPWEDDFEIDFGSSMDAVPLEFREIKTVVAINLEQIQAPNWKVEGD